MTKTTAQTITEGNTKFYGLDHLRALAIVLVFLYHYSIIFPHPQWVESIGKFGWTGVDLFFVLSGYLIASQLFTTISSNNTFSFKTFFLKRFFRIVPAYLVVVALYFCLPFVREREAPAPLWKYVTFTQNLGLDLRTQGTFSHAWSLCIEEQFYLLLPLILLALLSAKAIKKGFWLLISLFLLGFAIRYYSYENFVAPYEDDDAIWVYWYKAIYYPTYCRLDGLITGVSLAALVQFRPKFAARLMKFGNGLLLLSFCILTGAYFLCLDHTSIEASVFSFPLISIGYGAMVLGALSPSCFLYKINSKTTTTLAVLSYATYLLHKMIIHITQQQLGRLHMAKDSSSLFFICIASCLLGAYILNKMIEKPFLKLRERLINKNRKPGR